MDQKMPPATARPGLNPRDALDILDIRTAHQLERVHHAAELARHAEAGPDVLHYLAGHGGVATRAAVAANPATPAVTNRLLADDDDENVRAELAVKIARLMPGLAERESSHIVALTIETLECLARDAAVRVRAILADEIKTLDCVPKHLVLALARDLQAVVATPILQYSPLLSDADLVEIIACAKVQEALCAIASRKPLSEAVSDRLVQSLDVPAVAALLVNRDAKIRQQTMDRIIAQAEEINAWHMPLALRADLSARAIRRIGALVGSGMIERLAARNDLPDATRLHLNCELRARLAQAETSMTTHDTPAEVVAHAQKDGRLDGLFVEQAAQGGRREVVILALAKLANAPEQTVRKMLGSGNAKPVVALVWHAHLSMRVAFKIQTGVMRLAGPALLPAREGVGFPLTKEEMRWHLSYFNIT